ncbi:hypothetical protein [Romboutsia sp. 1001713B170207_170306_H8]|uniref:hypothetical protein n=1 Tax=Romboutsia sp. 1001713B170207_170306_H8 TaxID=2787112 RepID=UPI000823576C|nr:hypothetical protein [Romboutsia sp. 1001713B170207_170306_H8]SCI04137.1 Uncharacterised protein [uncultured Clostridium sp.]
MLSVRYKDTIVSVIAIVSMGIFINKIDQSIVFLTCYLPLNILVGLKNKECIEIHFVKSIFIFLVTILSSEIIDIEFYKELIIFYSLISMVGINILAPIYKRYNSPNNLRTIKNKLMIVMSFIYLLLVLFSLNSNKLIQYIFSISNPILIVYIALIIEIIKENIIID